MPTITLSDAAFAELKSLAEPFVDTPESLTAKIIHDAFCRSGAQLNGFGQPRAAQDDIRWLDPDTHENLKHTRLISATVDGQPIHRPKWNGLHEHLHILAYRRLGSFDALKQA